MTIDTGRAIALERIREATDAEILVLSNLSLTEVPSEVVELTQLKTLVVRSNQLSGLPTGIGQLTQLQWLDVSSNQLSSLPTEIGQLTQLRRLYVGSNRLCSLPTEIGRLTQLFRLDVISNQLNSLPTGIGQLAQLQWLDARNNLLSSLPTEIGKLTRLKGLDVRDNRLSSLPTEIGKLTRLKGLDVGNNLLSSLPAEIGQLAQLLWLDARNNLLGSLPTEIGKLTQLRKLDLRKNKGLGIPPEILEPERAWRTPGRSPFEILAYYFRSREASQPLLEAKLLIVGQGAVGKTSLVKRLVHGDFDPDEEKTKGIDIVRWSFPSSKLNDATIRVNIWDFGGQEIMHATHQFFLTKRSLYLLVLEARKGENEGHLHYWLRIIQSFGADSPVLVVVNKYEPPNELELNQTRLRRDFAPNIRGFLRTSCKTGEGIETLRKAITEEIQQLEHVYDAVPQSFFTVKTKLEKRTAAKDYIEHEVYEAICKEHGLEKTSDQRLLLGFLHDLGSVLHYDDENGPYPLAETKILNPEWVTRGVYKVLNNRELTQAQGVLELRHLDRILTAGEGYTQKNRLFIIGMMRKFELCFEFPDHDGRFLVAELLSKNEPELGFDETAALRFEYHYEILPEGILPRLIVRMHEHLTSKPTYWRSGVILQIDDNRAFVRGDSQAGRVYVSVFDEPRGRRRALAVVRSQLRAIHRTISGLIVQEMVPLTRDPGKVVEYEHLLRLEKRRTRSFLPQGAAGEYEVRELLEGIESLKGEEDFQSRHRIEPQTFLSYAWGGQSEETAEALERALQAKGIRIVRDKHELAFKRSITRFMTKLGRGQAVILVVSDKYLKSKNCMFELCEIFDNRQFSERIFPVVLPDAKIFDPLDLLDYVEHWQEKRDSLDAKMRQLKSLNNVEGIQDDLNLYDRIRDHVARLTSTLRDMNTLSLQHHQDSGFAELIDAVSRQTAT